MQRPHIPIWVPGDSEATRRLAADIGDVWLTYSKPPEVIAEWIEDMTRRRGGRRLPMAISTVSLAGLPQAEVDRWSVLYAKEREHRFAVPPTPQDVLDENLWGPPEAASSASDATRPRGSSTSSSSPSRHWKACATSRAR